MKANSITKEKKNVIQQMVDDKKAIREYIKKNGTLKGFKSETIKFGKPF
ncbi:hypothetical protein [Bacteroides sp. 224]|nr:hypothetical protein [Bacteroides sp. 224]